MSPLRDYLAQIQQAVSTFPGTHIEEYREQLLTATRANLCIRLHLADNSLLEISEALVVEAGALTWLSYRYHWQASAGNVILRYDNAPHHPELETFPHHKHLGSRLLALNVLRSLISLVRFSIFFLGVTNVAFPLPPHPTGC